MTRGMTHSCEKTLERNFPGHDQACDGEKWTCTCGNVWEHYCDEANGCSWKHVPVTIIVPLVPPSVNHYVKHTRRGGHYVTDEAKAFKDTLALFARRGARVVATKYEVRFVVFLGKGKRGDPDNFCKVIGDALKDAGVIHSDHKVRWVADTGRDWTNPRTEIEVRWLA